MAMRFEVEHLTVGYETPLLRDISFSAGAGETVGLLGRNGCGKTTLLRGIAGSIRRFSGRVLVDGKDCAAMTLRQQARCLSLLPQRTALMDGILARRLIGMGRYPYGGLFRDGSEAEQEKILRSARQLGIEPLLDCDCAKLSQGQRQLVLLCRMMVQDTPVMLLDEPNTALDYDNMHLMFRTVRSLVREGGKTALLVLHDPEQALHYCSRLLLMKDGAICAELQTDRVDAGTAQAALRQLYPSITVRKDPADGRLRCDNETNAGGESLC